MAYGFFQLCPSSISSAEQNNMIDEPALRAAIIAEALTWKGTLYHPKPSTTAAKVAKLKGVRADCMSFIIGVYYNLGILEDFEIPFYRPDFMRHDLERDLHGRKAEEKYFDGALIFGHEVEDPLMGDLVFYRFKPTEIFAHAGIVINWPEEIIHCFRGRYGVITAKGNQGGHCGVERRFISAFPLESIPIKTR
jgi:hypothetical protein